MSLKIMTAVWEKSKQTGGKLLLMLAISDNANDLGYAWPGETTLAHKTRLSKRQIQRLVHELANEANELAIIWGGSAARMTNKYYVLVGKTQGEIDTILHHVSEQNAKRQSPLPLPESRAEDMGDKMSPVVMGDISDSMGDTLSGMGDVFRGMGDTAMSLEPSLTEPSLIEPSEQNHHQQRVTVSLSPSCLNLRAIGDDGDFLSVILDDLDIRGNKRREIERQKPRADFVLAHALYAASRDKRAGWIITETLAGAIPPSEFLGFARLTPDEWRALWRGSARGEWSTCPPQLYATRGPWLQAFDGIFEHEPFIEIPIIAQPELPIEPDKMAPIHEDRKDETTAIHEPTEFERIWSEALDRISMELTRSTYDCYLKYTHVVNEKCNGKLVIAPTRYRVGIIDLLNKRMRPLIERAVREAAKREIEIEFICESGTKTEQPHTFIE